MAAFYLGIQRSEHKMATTFKLVSNAMIPKEWRFTEEQERDWLTQVAAEMPGETASTLQRIVAIELPDFPVSYAYQQAYMDASEHRDDLVAPVITSREQWTNRLEEMKKVIKCLLEGNPPMVFCAMAVKK